MTIRLEILGDDGEWHQVPGVRSVEFHSEEPTEPPDDAYWRRHDALDALHFAMPFADTVEVEIPVNTGDFEAACASAEEAMSRLAKRFPRVIDQDGNPVRPAWQSPYGPPPRRH